MFSLAGNPPFSEQESYDLLDKFIGELKAQKDLASVKAAFDERERDIDRMEMSAQRSAYRWYAQRLLEVSPLSHRGEYRDADCCPVCAELNCECA